MSDKETEDRGMTRLSFIKASAGAAAGMAAISVPGAAALPREKAGVQTDPSSPTPREPVIAYVRDAGRHEVTVVSGTHEETYRDRALVRRMMAAAPKRSTRKGR
jgi:hypothetical protein